GMDRRIGRSFLNAGIGYGGSCFPKDVAAFIHISEQLGVPFSLLKEVQRINAGQKERFLKLIRDTLWVLREKKIAVWGLTFKPDTDDVRSSVAIELVDAMLREGAHVVVYDPKGMEKARDLKAIADAKFAASALEAVDGAEALVIATEWNEFANVDLTALKRRMTTPIVFDGRARFPLSFHWPREHHSALEFVVARTSARRVALAALRNWRRKKEFADAVISSALSKAALHSADRAFAVELFYGVLRNRTLLDFWIRELRHGRVDVDLRDILRIGLYQLFIAKTPEHAAVYETVDLSPKRQHAIINAILRSAARDRRGLQRRANSQPLDVRTSHPQFLIERWTKQFGAGAAEALCTWNNQSPLIYARINRLKIDRHSFLERYRNARTLPNVSNFIELPAPVDALDQGDCYVQDPSTSIACELLQPKPGEKLLDACAAPGGKTGYLAELMANQGLLIACDREPARLNLLDENLARLGVRIAKIVCHDWMKSAVPPEIPSAAPFDRILIDAPCTNTGVMRR